MGKNRKILIIRFSSIGDIVLTSPVVRCLKTRMQNAEVHYLTKKQFLPIVEANPYIDKVWIYDNNFRELIPMLKSEHFDFIVDLHKNYRSFFVRLMTGVPSGTFPKLNIRKWLMVRMKINLLPPIHIVDRYFKAVKKLRVENDREGLDYFIPSKDRVDPEILPETHRRGFIAIVIGGKHNTKIFPSEKLTQVCRQLPVPLILLGGKEDHERGEDIANSGPLIFNTCGKYTLNQSASILSRADAVLSNDTGLMHIAAAFRKPIVSVWGNTIPAFGMYPYLPDEFRKNSLIAEVKGLSCRPCSKLGHTSCPKKHFNCMKQIDHELITGFLMKNAGYTTNGMQKDSAFTDL